MKKPTAKNASLMVTGIAEFYRCDGEDGLRYYPKTGDKRAAAIDYSSDGLPPTVKGYAVYDTTISGDYAVALYGSEAEAQQHTAVPAPTAPTTIFEEPEVQAEPEQEPEPEEEPDAPAKFSSKRKKSDD